MDIIQQLVKLIKINTRISSLHSSDEILKEIMNEAMSLTGTNAAFILRVSASRELSCLARYHSGALEPGTNWSSSSALEAHDAQRMVYSTRALESSAAPSIVMGSIQTLISSPLSAEKDGTIVLQLVGRDTTSIDPQTISLLNLFVSQVQVTASKSKLEKSAIRNAALAATGELAAQVAHDIRSPLAALEVAAGEAGQLPEENRILIQGAVARIRDIANSLLERQRSLSADATFVDAGQGPLPAMERASPQLLSGLIESLVSEKRLQFRSRVRVSIESRLDAPSYGLFASVQPVEFKRLLSNLINNSVEALDGGAGTVRVGLTARGGQALVAVHDDGKGIPPAVLARLGRRGETHDKAGGTGLGLHHARASAESWNGRLELSSEAGKGTTATTILPLAPAPDWFVSELALTPGRCVVILDDDASIHQVWQGRLDALGARGSGVEIVHVSTPDAIRGWVGANAAKASSALYLFDHELIGYRETGLSLAEELGIAKTVVLVTSRYEEPAILEACRTLKTRMIPKGLAGLVPIAIGGEPRNSPGTARWDAVLIDDDRLARMTWAAAAKKSGKLLLTYSSSAEFLAASGAIDRRTPVYIDVELVDGMRGESASLRIHELGFREVYLATGHPAEKFKGLAHLRGVVGKEPPWSAAG
jgi:signal transduction histidine kinase